MGGDKDTPCVLIFDDPEALARAAASRFVELVATCIDECGRFSVALSGGSTPRRIYELLAGGEFASRVDWSKVHIFFGDERCVPPDEDESNYRMARETLLSRIDVAPENVHRMIGEGDAVANARLYEDELRSFFGGDSLPRFDLVMLGLGDDGHTASLFPATPALDECAAWVVANRIEKFDTYRLTLTAPVINNAAHIMFVVAGTGKAGRLHEVIEGARDPHRLPAQLIRPADGSLEWFVDRAAASRLEKV
jgi:6-phosphogluconolactonase